MGLIILFLFPLTFFLAIGVLIYIIINMKKEQKTPNLKISSHTLLQLYLYLISFITLGVLVIGIGLTSTGSLSSKISIPFSYTLSTANKEKDSIDYRDSEEFQECYSGEVMRFYNEDFCFDKSERKTELVTGISLIVSMSLLFGMHRYAISRISKQKSIVWIKKAYLFFSLLLYSLLTIILIPLTIYLLTSFFLFEPSPDMYYSPSAPAMSTATMITTIPLWIYFLKKTTELKEK